MEINGRVWGSLPLAVLSGMDFPSRLADLYLRRRARTCNGAPRHKLYGRRTSRNLELDMLWIATVLYGKRDYPFFPMPGRGQAVKALLELFNPGYKYDVQSLSDPRAWDWRRFPGSSASWPAKCNKYESNGHAQRRAIVANNPITSGALSLLERVDDGQPDFLRVLTYHRVDDPAGAPLALPAHHGHAASV